MCRLLENTGSFDPQTRSLQTPIPRTRISGSDYTLAIALRHIIAEIDISNTRRFQRELSYGFTCFDRLLLDSPALILLSSRTLDDLALCKLNPTPVPFFRLYDDSQLNHHIKEKRTAASEWA